MKCNGCGEEISERRKCGFCKICYARDYRKRNKDKIAPVAHAKYMRRRKYFMKQSQEWDKRSGYARDKTGKRKQDALIRRTTRYKYPLKGNTCQFCSKSAKERHHTTNPIEVDKFIFVCEEHHKKIHNKEFLFGRKDE